MTAVMSVDAVPSAVADVISSTVAPRAVEIDATGAYPSAALRELGAARVLGLMSSRDVGGLGGSLADAAGVIEDLGEVCGSTAMVVLMHFAATAAIEAHGPRPVREAIARGEHISTLAFSESGSRSHFWSPLGTASDANGRVRLDASKSWVTSAGEADSYVWSSRPLGADTAGMTLWLVSADVDGLDVAGKFDGFGLRGNASKPMSATGILVGPDARLGADGDGMDIALGAILPVFLVLSAAFSVGVMNAMITRAESHLTTARFEHLGMRLADQPVTRADYAQLKLRADEAHAFVADTLSALGAARGDATLRVLEAKAVAGEAAAEVGSGVMALCGGAAFRKDVGVERHFRDALAARVMAPTTAALHDFVARASLGMPLLDGEVSA